VVGVPLEVTVPTDLAAWVLEPRHLAVVIMVIAAVVLVVRLRRE
jgi:hypothetical protein